MVRQVFSNRIEITCVIYESLFFLPYKNLHEPLSSSRIIVLRPKMTLTRVIHCSNLYSRCIGPGFFALLSITGFLPTLRLFVAFSFTIGANDLFSAAVFMWKVGNKSIILLRLRRSGRCRAITYWQRWFRLTIQVGLELLRESNQIMLCFWNAWLFADFWLHRLVQSCNEEHNFHLSRIVGLISNLCFEGIESLEKCIFPLIGRFFGFHQIKLWWMDPIGAIS